MAGGGEGSEELPCRYMDGGGGREGAGSAPGATAEVPLQPMERL